MATLHERIIGLISLYYMRVLHHGGTVASIQEIVVTEECVGGGSAGRWSSLPGRGPTNSAAPGLNWLRPVWVGQAYWQGRRVGPICYRSKPRRSFVDRATKCNVFSPVV